MKTTLDLPDDLLIEAKAVAARRRTTLKAIVEHALRREIQQPASSSPPLDSDLYETGPFGILRLKRNRGDTVTLETIRKIQDDIEQEEFDRALNFARPR